MRALSRADEALLILHHDLHRIRKLRRNPAKECYSFQVEALSVVRAAESRIRKNRRCIERERRRLGGIDGARLSKEQSTKAKAAIRRHHERIEQARWTIRTAKSLVDGLAFLFLPKWDIKPLSSKESAGFVSGKVGLRTELRLLRVIAHEEKRVAILNDLTNCLRYGDVTVSADPPQVVEVKSGSARGERVRRQQSKVQAIVEYLRRDVWDNFDGAGLRLRRAASPTMEHHHRGGLASLVAEGLKSGAVVRTVEPGLCYIAIGTHDASAALAEVVRRLHDPVVVPLLGKSVSAYYSPLSLSIHDTATWWGVATTRIVLMVAIDRQKVVELFAAKGIEATWTDENCIHMGPGWRLSKPSVTRVRNFGVSGQYFRRVADEFLSLKWFVDSACQTYERVCKEASKS